LMPRPPGVPTTTTTLVSSDTGADAAAGAVVAEGASCAPAVPAQRIDKVSIEAVAYKRWWVRMNIVSLL
jgi:hypothetical protein